MKAVLRNCENYNKSQMENLLVYQAILKINLPKLLTEDVPIFTRILADLFPDAHQQLQAKKEQLSYSLFSDVCKKNNLQPTKQLFTKLIQTHEIMNTAHSFVMVGRSFSCKTTVLKILAEILPASDDLQDMDEDDECRCDLGKYYAFLYL